MQYTKILLLILLSCALTSCGIYRMNIRQGNIIEQKNVDKIQMGMTKGQVRFLLGRPIVNDSFDDNTWYYVYTFKSGADSDMQRRELVLTFENDRVISLSGDFDAPESFSNTMETDETKATSMVDQQLP